MRILTVSLAPTRCIPEPCIAPRQLYDGGFNGRSRLGVGDDRRSFHDRARSDGGHSPDREPSENNDPPNGRILKTANYTLHDHEFGSTEVLTVLLK